MPKRKQKVPDQPSSGLVLEGRPAGMEESSEGEPNGPEDCDPSGDAGIQGTSSSDRAAVTSPEVTVASSDRRVPSWIFMSAVGVGLALAWMFWPFEMRSFHFSLQVTTAAVR